MIWKYILGLLTEVLMSLKPRAAVVPPALEYDPAPNWIVALLVEPITLNAKFNWLSIRICEWKSRQFEAALMPVELVALLLDMPITSQYGPAERELAKLMSSHRLPENPVKRGVVLKLYELRFDWEY